MIGRCWWYHLTDEEKNRTVWWEDELFDELGKCATNGHDIMGPAVIKSATINTTVESVQINTIIGPHEQGPVVGGATDVEPPRVEGQRTDWRRDKAVKVARLGGVIRVLQ